MERSALGVSAQHKGMILSIASLSRAENDLCKSPSKPGAIRVGHANYREDFSRSTISLTYHTDARGVADHYNPYI